MSTPREEEAAHYLENHKILELMNNLTSMLFYYRPEHPKEFLITQLEQMQASKLQATSCPCLFDDSNLDAVCGILDPINQGFISYNQYREAMKTLGIHHFNECPEGLGNDKISHETFKREADWGNSVVCLSKTATENTVTFVRLRAFKLRLCATAASFGGVRSVHKDSAGEREQPYSHSSRLHIHSPKSSTGTPKLYLAKAEAWSSLFNKSACASMARVLRRTGRTAIDANGARHLIRQVLSLGDTQPSDLS
ncbi:EF-hand calcium-binding domain-containing protein 10 isoform X3 [Silurus asotus]|uniref:EF-hand calcium-binding domain-containing protein 10 isoform X3 n=1 Tax=Silurus asotus TaxID=30991 RepID=A0AAD5B462_SILAS|nr:EF-hand calcium-binding domain-containing protein 10 isoform X3 [Silurus asotus]